LGRSARPAGRSTLGGWKLSGMGGWGWGRGWREPGRISCDLRARAVLGWIGFCAKGRSGDCDFRGRKPFCHLTGGLAATRRGHNRTSGPAALWAGRQPSAQFRNATVWMSTDDAVIHFEARSTNARLGILLLWMASRCVGLMQRTSANMQLLGDAVSPQRVALPSRL
jgi:hypothetical protein